MPTRDSRAAAEADFRALLEAGGLPEPDEVVEEKAGELVFLFHAPQVAIVVEYSPTDPPPAAGGSA